jgi:hypothetical protein
MRERLKILVRRRDLLRAMMAGAAVAATSTVARESVAAQPYNNSSNKRKARYQANSVEVQDFYRVNRYPAK